MIIQEEKKIGEKFFIYTYSDERFFIERDGELYADALDPHFLGREYTETNKKIPEENENENFDFSLE